MAKTTAVRVKDLPEPRIPGSFLYCSHCGERYSADRGDYFMAHPDTIMRCGQHRQRLILAQAETRIVPICGAILATTPLAGVR